MSKSKPTKLIEEALEEHCRRKRIYGCSEVTIGFYYQGKADEIVDFMTIDSHNIIRCYEIKISLADMHSKAKLSFYGNYNYFVVTKELYDQIDKWNVDLTGIGVVIATPVKKYKYVGTDIKSYESVDLTTKIKPKQRIINSKEYSMLKNSLIRSMYWKMEKFKKMSDPINYTALQSALRKSDKDYKDLKKELEEYKLLYNSMMHYLIKNKIFTYEEIVNIENSFNI